MHFHFSLAGLIMIVSAVITVLLAFIIKSKVSNRVAPSCINWFVLMLISSA